MKRHFLVRRSVSTLIVATVALGGCSWFHRDQVQYYKGTQETRPLEVPPDLDAPPTSRELVVPGSTPAAGGASSAGAGIAPPSAATGLVIADSIDNAYQRLGLALDRAQLGKVASKDDATHSYAYDFDGTVTTKPVPQEHHWYSRILHPFGDSNKPESHNVKATLRVNVTPDGSGARVDVAGAPGDKSGEEAAQQLITVLRERLS